MPTIPLTLRLVKGSKLTFGELDQNFINLRNAINSVSNSDTFVTGGTYNPATVKLEPDWSLIFALAASEILILNVFPLN